MAGKFIVIEGIDGSGKSTQARRLSDFLRAEGYRVFPTYEPGHHGYGATIRKILTSTEATQEQRASLPWLFALDRFHHVVSMTRRLQAGDWVVCDRYILSSLAYNTEFMGVFDVLGLNATFPRPDLTVVLDCSVGKAVERIAARGQDLELFETKQQLERTATSYRIACRVWHAYGAQVEIVDADQSREQVHEAVTAAVRGIL